MGVYASWVTDQAGKPPQRVLMDTLRDLLPTRVRGVLSRGRQAILPPPATAAWNGEMPFLTEALRRSKAGRPSRRRARPRIVHVIGTLGAGGAERQLCNFVIGARQLGHDVRVLLMWDADGDHAHYAHLLEDAGVPVIVAGSTFHPKFPTAITKVPGGLIAVNQIPPECWPVVVDLLGEFVSDPPDVVHAWLDGSNVWGGMAAVLAQVPCVILSTRNVNPSNFASLNLPFFRQAYRELLKSPTVRLINNSEAGAVDYAEWLGISPDQIPVVLNGLDFSRLCLPSDDEVAAFRERVGVPSHARIVAGVFRLAEEKQPFTFLEVIQKLRADCPDVMALIAGVGPLTEDLRDYVAANGLTEHVRFLWRQRDIAPLYAAAHVTLLCSRKEGTPNVLLEAQWLGCPVVATKAGGAVGAVDDGVTGYLCDVGDIEALTAAVRELLDDDELRARMGASGRPFVKRHFSVDRMVEETLNLYGITHEQQYSV